MLTQAYKEEHTNAPYLVVLENNQIRSYQLNPNQLWRIGRYEAGAPNPPEVMLTSQLASREHGSICMISGAWYYQDNPRNTNGTFFNGGKIPRSSQPGYVPLKSGDVLRIDKDDLHHGSSRAVMMLFTTATVRGAWSVMPLKNPVTTIGRDPSNTIVEPWPYISARHAQIQYSGGRFYLSDCHSRAGTFLNGQRVTGTVPLHDKDSISICDCNYLMLGNQLLYLKREKENLSANPQERPVILSANIHSKRVNISKIPMVRKEKELLRDVNVQIREGTLVAVLGTAGAGKSTLMGCLSGLDQSGVSGTVIYRGVDLVRNLDQIKYLIGNVPQEKVIRPELTPEQAFLESAELRLSAETTKEQIQQKVEQTLALLSMTKVRDTLNSRLSGGEQTRVNVGIDLVADRDIYFLDEPEQGLSPNLRDELYVFLRDLAHSHGKTIVAIIHDVSCIDMFDQVIFLVKADGVGRLAFSGSPEEGSRHFGVPISKAYALLEADPEKYVR